MLYACLIYNILREGAISNDFRESYLVTETGNERLGKQKLDLVVL